MEKHLIYITVGINLAIFVICIALIDSDSVVPLIGTIISGLWLGLFGLAESIKASEEEEE